jgi:hypothetical protein
VRNRIVGVIDLATFLRTARGREEWEVCVNPLCLPRFRRRSPLRDDPALADIDLDTREWLFAILERGEGYARVIT